MKLKNPIYFYLFFIFVLINIADAITAFFILPGEGNPLFLISGSIIPVFIIKGLVILGFWFYYDRNIYRSHFMYYYFITLLVFGIMLMGLGLTSNIIGIANPALIDDAAAVSSGDKMQLYFTFSMVLYLIPMLLNFLVFWLYDISTKYVKFDKEFYKKRGRWKI